LFGTFLTHALLVQLPQQLPALPGVQEAAGVDLERAQTEAMHPQQVRSRVEAAVQAQAQLLRQAYGEDADAVTQILADDSLPEAVKTPLRDGGIRAVVEAQLSEQADSIQSQLRRGAVGRQQLLDDESLPEGVRQQLANVPVRALRD